MTYQRRNFLLAGAPIVLMALVASCGASNSDPSPAPTKPTANDSTVPGGPQTFDVLVTPPKAYYDALLTDRLAAVDAGTVSGEVNVWVNFNGAKITKGYGRGQSFLVCGASVVIAAPNISPADQKTILDEAAQYYSNAGVKVNFTFDQPSSGDYTEMVVGGSYSDLGCVGGAGVLGIAPFDVGNADPNDVGFAFLPPGGDLHMLAETIAHEAGHTFGLDHTDNKKDVMYPTVTSQLEGFAIGTATSSGQQQNGPVVLQQNVGSGVASVSGASIPATVQVPVLASVQPASAAPSPTSSSAPSSSATSSSTPSSTGAASTGAVIPALPNIPISLAGLPGLGTLGSLNQILSQLTPALQGALSGKIPSIGTLPAGVNLKNPQGILSALTVAMNGSIKQNPGAFNIQNLLGMFTNPGNANLGSLIGVIGMGANPAAGAASLIPIAIPAITSALQSGQVQNLDLTKLLGISGMTNPGQLISLLPKYSQIISGNVPGANGQALMDFVKMALTQAMSKMP